MGRPQGHQKGAFLRNEQRGQRGPPLRAKGRADGAFLQYPGWCNAGFAANKKRCSQKMQLESAIQVDNRHFGQRSKLPDVRRATC